jgi:hypothetical protein
MIQLVNIPAAFLGFWVLPLTIWVPSQFHLISSCVLSLSLSHFFNGVLEKRKEIEKGSVSTFCSTMESV